MRKLVNDINLNLVIFQDKKEKKTMIEIPHLAEARSYA